MNEKADLVVVRDMLPNDHNFILATWLRGLKYGNSWFNAIDPTCYFKAYHKVIEAVLSNPTANVKVACLKENPDVILGYVVYSGPILHWVFVKKAWRHIGIARMITPQSIDLVTHLTDTGKSILNKKTSIKFNPFAL